MNQLYSSQELQAMLALLNRSPMSPAEQLFAQSFFQRLVAFCRPPSESEEPEAETAQGLETEDARAAADTQAIANALDRLDEEKGNAQVKDEMA